MPEFLGNIVAILWLLGIVSALLACPLKLIEKIVTWVGTCTATGLIFTIIGAVFGFMIGAVFTLWVIFLPPR